MSTSIPPESATAHTNPPSLPLVNPNSIDPQNSTPDLSNQESMPTEQKTKEIVAKQQAQFRIIHSHITNPMLWSRQARS